MTRPNARRTTHPPLLATPGSFTTVYYDGNCGLCTRTVRFLSSFDWFHQVRWIPSQSLTEPPAGLSWDDLDRSAYLYTGHRRYAGFYAFRRLTLTLPPLLLLAPIFWCPGIHLLGVPVYRWIARRRHRLFGCPLPPAPSDHQPGASGRDESESPISAAR